MGWVIEIVPKKIEAYKKLHAEAWPDVLRMISSCHIKNYTIFLREPENLLFSCFEYHGDDYEADMQRMSEDPITQKWWELTDPCQKALSSAKKTERWAPMEEVFHHD